MSGPKRGRIVERPIVGKRRELRDVLRETSTSLRIAQDQLTTARLGYAESGKQCDDLEGALAGLKLGEAQQDVAWRTFSKAQLRRPLVGEAISALAREVGKLDALISQVAGQVEAELELAHIDASVATLRQCAGGLRSLAQTASERVQEFSKMLDHATRQVRGRTASPHDAGGKSSAGIAAASQLLALVESQASGLQSPALAKARQALHRLTQVPAGSAAERDASELCERLLELQEHLTREAASEAAKQAEAHAAMRVIAVEMAASRDDVSHWSGRAGEVAEVEASLKSVAPEGSPPSKSLPELAHRVSASWTQLKKLAAENKERHVRREQIAQSIANSLAQRLYDEPVGRFEKEVNGSPDPLSDLIIYAEHPAKKGDIRVHLAVDGQVRVEVGGVSEGEEEICRDLVEGFGEAVAADGLTLEVTDWGRAMRRASADEDQPRQVRPRETEVRDRQERSRE